MKDNAKKLICHSDNRALARKEERKMEYEEKPLKYDRGTFTLSKRIGRKLRGVLAPLALFPLMAGWGGCFNDQPVSGFRISVADFPAEPSHNYVFFSSKDAASLTVPAAESSGDPTMFGGTIELFNLDTGQQDAYNLPQKNWTALPAPEEGYSYLDSQHNDGPCEYVAVVAGERLIASCRGADVHFMLEQPQTGTLNFSLTLGTVGGTRYCAAFGGHVMRNISTAQAEVGSFLATDAPAPSNCSGL